MKTWKLIMLMFCTSEGNVEGGRKENREIWIPENGSNKAEEVFAFLLLMCFTIAIHTTCQFQYFFSQLK